MKTGKLISACLMVRNEEVNLERCLKSIKPLSTLPRLLLVVWNLIVLPQKVCRLTTEPKNCLVKKVKINIAKLAIKILYKELKISFVFSFGNFL